MSGEEGTAPLEQPVVPQEAVPGQEAPVQPKISEVRSSLREGLRVTPNIDPETGKHDLRSESGQFASVSEEGVEAGAEEAPVETPGEEVEVSGTETEVPLVDTAVEGEAPAVEEAVGEAPEKVTVEVPEGHWLRDRGYEQVPFEVDQEWAEYLQGMLQDPVKRSDLRAMSDKAAQAEIQRNEAAAAAEFWQERAAYFAQNPEIALRVEQIHESMGEEEAKRYVNGLMQEDFDTLEAKVSEARSNSEMQAVMNDAMVFVEYARKDLARVYPGKSPAAIDKVIESYGRAVESGEVQRLHKDEMRNYAVEFFGKQGGMEEKTPEPEMFTKEQVEKAAQEAREKALAEASAANNPMGSIPRGSVAKPPQDPSVVSGSPQDTGINVREVRRNLKAPWRRPTA